MPKVLISPYRLNNSAHPELLRLKAAGLDLVFNPNGRNFTSDELRDITVRLARLDHALKGGSRLAPDLELERALIAITKPR